MNKFIKLNATPEEAAGTENIALKKICTGMQLRNKLLECEHLELSILQEPTLKSSRSVTLKFLNCIETLQVYGFDRCKKYSTFEQKKLDFHLKNHLENLAMEGLSVYLAEYKQYQAALTVDYEAGVITTWAGVMTPDEINELATRDGINPYTELDDPAFYPHEMEGYGWRKMLKIVIADPNRGDKFIKIDRDPGGLLSKVKLAA